jgi:hypothetical protein
MTDTQVENFLIATFEGIGSPLLTSTTVDSKTTYTNICYENRAFNRPTDNYWFGLHFIPTLPYQQELGKYGKNRWHGIFQVDICVPKDSGTDAMNDRYNTIVNAFPRGYITDGIRILKVGRSSARSTDDFCFTPVSISWQADLDN